MKEQESSSRLLPIPNLTHTFISRQKREDDCMDCLGRDWTSSHDVMERWKLISTCEGKNIVICKECTANELTGVSQHSKDHEFDVICFDTGSVTNTVWHT